ncbi:hypothetical protein H650_06960 [Enterobacter sp. R4-368]|nr:hypothetical protein H650_06960 [Enterobacter sp. R4-368]
MVVLYFSEFTLELLKRAEALVLVTLPQVDNALRFWLPADDTHRDAVLVSESAVEFAHSCLAFR